MPNTLTDNIAIKAKYAKVISTVFSANQTHGWDHPSQVITPKFYVGWLGWMANRLRTGEIRRSTINTYNTAIKKFVLASTNDWAALVAGPEYRRIWDAITTHTSLEPSRQDYPITRQDLATICSKLPALDSTAVACATIATFLFHSLGRVSELLHSPEAPPLTSQSLHAIKEGNGLRTTYKFLLQRPKIRTGEDQWLDPIESNYCSPSTDPHSLLFHYLDLRKRKGEDDLTKNSVMWITSEGTPLTAKMFKKYILKVTGHTIGECSFRAGGATMLAALRVPFEDIRRLGRWQSDAFERYIRNHSLILKSRIEHEQNLQLCLDNLVTLRPYSSIKEEDSNHGRQSTLK